MAALNIEKMSRCLHAHSITHPFYIADTMNVFNILFIF